MKAGWCYGNHGCHCDDCLEARGGYGTAECIDCGIESPRLLAPRFPHICSRCLFPPVQPDPRELPQSLLVRAKRTAVARDTA